MICFKLIISSICLLFSFVSMAQLCGDGESTNQFPFEMLQQKLTSYYPSLEGKNSVSDIQFKFQVDNLKNDLLDLTVFIYRGGSKNIIAKGHLILPKSEKELHFELESADPKIQSLKLEGKEGLCRDMFPPLPHIGAALSDKNNNFYKYLGLFP